MKTESEIWIKFVSKVQVIAVSVIATIEVIALEFGSL
jgi:hypothetical protein